MHGGFFNVLFLILLPALLLCTANGQVSPAAASPPASTESNSGFFDTNVNLESSATDKAATLGLATPPLETPTKAATASSVTKPKHRGEFAFAPIPMINPSIGNGGGAALLYARRLGPPGETSPPSTFAVGGFATGRGSWGLGLGTRLYLLNDRFRILAGGGGGEFNYNFFGVGTAGGQAGISIPLFQQSRGFLIEPKMQVWPHWYAGPRYHLITNHTGLGSHKYDPSKLPIPLPPDLKFQTAALGLRVQRDTSNNTFYPTSGSFLDLLTDFFAPAFGGDRSYQNMTLSFDKYLGVGLKNVFAVHGSLCTASEKTPFFDVCELGMSKDLRGYQIGQFRDYRMLVGQAEYRRELFWRLGAVAFAGAGAVGKTFGDMGSAEPGGGIGVRFVMAKRNHINLRADFAWGDNSHATYVSLGEAF